MYKRPIDILRELRKEARSERLALALDIAICEADLGSADELRPLVEAYCRIVEKWRGDVWPRRDAS